MKLIHSGSLATQFSPARALCLLSLGWIALVSCNAPLAAIPSLGPTATSTQTPTPTATSTPTPSSTPTATFTSTTTYTPTITLTPSITPTPTVTPTATFDFPDAEVNVSAAHCRYGPDTAYLHAGDLYEGDHGLVWNRNYNAGWLWVRFDKLTYACWVSATVVEVAGDPFTVVTYVSPLPTSVLYGPVQNVSADRQGDQVTVTWDELWMTVDDDRGYFLEVRLCTAAGLIDDYAHTDGTSYTFTDLTTCGSQAGGRISAVEKHGYTDFVPIPWP